MIPALQTSINSSLCPCHAGARQRGQFRQSSAKNVSAGIEVLIVLRQILPEHKDYRFVLSAFFFINIIKAVFDHVFIGVCHVLTGKTLGKVGIPCTDGFHDGAMFLVGSGPAADI